MNKKFAEEVMYDLSNRDDRDIINGVSTFTPQIKKTKTFNYPDAKLHQIISFVKSGIRIFGYGLLFVDVPTAAVVLILSEVVGIVEELV